MSRGVPIVDITEKNDSSASPTAKRRSTPVPSTWMSGVESTSPTSDRSRRAATSSAVSGRDAADRLPPGSLEERRHHRGPVADAVTDGAWLPISRRTLASAGTGSGANRRPNSCAAPSLARKKIYPRSITTAGKGSWPASMLVSASSTRPIRGLVSGPPSTEGRNRTRASRSLRSRRGTSSAQQGAPPSAGSAGPDPSPRSSHSEAWSRRPRPGPTGSCLAPSASDAGDHPARREHNRGR